MPTSLHFPPRIRYACPDFREAECEAVLRQMHSGMVGPGAMREKFEHELADYLSTPHRVLATNSGSAALLLAVRDLDLPPGSRIGVPAFTFVATVNAIYEAGHTPVFIDIEPDTLCISRRTVRAALEHTLLDAIIAVNYGGHIVDQLNVFNLPIIVDAAHSFNPAATFGQDSVCFSFGPIKNLSCGSGGAYVGANPNSLRDADNGRPNGVGGFNFLMPDLNAAIGLEQLKTIDLRDRRRQEILWQYFDGGLPLAQPLTSDLLTHPHLAVIRTPKRDALRAFFVARGIETQIHYPLPPVRDCLPNTEAAAREVLSLPLHSRLTDQDVDEVIDTYYAWRNS